VIGDPRPKATSAMMAAMGAISSTTPTAGTRPMLIVNTSLAYRVWLKDGLESRTATPNVELPALQTVASEPKESRVRALILGDQDL
jgi:hypothetical protein